MKLREASVIVIVCIIGAAAAIGWLSARWLGDDNVVEESAEAAIKEVSGVDIDLTPSSPEALQDKLIDRYLQKNA